MLTVCCDLAASPPTYEAVSFAMRAECERLARGEEALRVLVLPGPAEGFRRDTLWPRGGEARRALLRNVMVPILRLLPSVAKVEVLGHRPSPRECLGMPGLGRPFYGLHEYVAAYRRGVRPLRAAGAGGIVRDPRLVTITLREAEHWPERNSNVLQWLDAAARLQQRHGLRVVFVRDTRLADRPLDGFETDAAAARDIPARAALYSRAALNLFVCNGPAWLCMAMDLPTVMFRPVEERLGRAFTREHQERCGVPFGGQLPGAPAHHRLVWEQDSAEAIVAAVEQQIAANEVAA